MSTDSSTAGGDPAKAQKLAATRLLLVAAVASTILISTATAQCTDWPGGCPDLTSLALSDGDNSPTATDPGHTQEYQVCPPDVNENKRLQLDLTETYITMDAGGIPGAPPIRRPLPPNSLSTRPAPMVTASRPAISDIALRTGAWPSSSSMIS